ncbi:PAS/PAC sensor hybrid histidine kinase [Plesiocystis pacifica SIR-1]|uniref:histidine kinase n=1 Tax=Plesiocystis pacifica SIR-1 TaxID=391625 RepID=A6GKH0_9BACT|nr:ATP-binding protein [Plesiocystis pacifica]EDM73634.1 PAS/PAC sensor hybrid histidine kinase [Plesiocystis pacifica SIR-1]
MRFEEDYEGLGWRETLQLRFARADAIGALLMLPLVFIGFDVAEHWPMMLALVLLEGVLFGLSFFSRLHTHYLAVLTVLINLMFGGFAVAHLGWLPGPVIVLTTGVLMGGILLDRVGALVAVLGATTVFVGVGLGMSSGYLAIPEGHPAMGDLQLWLRVSVFSTGLWALLGVLTAYAINLIDEKANAEQVAQSDLAREKSRVAAIEQSRDQAKRAFVEAQRKETVAALAGGLAHDFNNTLMVIMSWAELLEVELGEASQGDEVLSEATSAVVTAAEQASFLARQLLSLGRQGTSTPEPVDVRGVMGLAVTSLRKLLPANIEVRLEAEAVDAVLAEPAQLQQIILNLAINARDAMPEGGRLSFGVRQERDDNGATWVILSVVDTGTGMDEETLDKVFEPFYTTKPAGKGSGLGLASVLAIVNQLGGLLEVDSELGEGTCFEIHLRARPDLSAAKVAAAQVEGEVSGRAVIIDNEPQVRAFLARTLESVGLEVHAVGDGDGLRGVLRELGDSPVALLCTESVVAGSRPAELIASAREHSAGCQVLICSGHLPDDAMRREIAAGRYAFLPKPFGSDELRRQVLSLLAD